MNRSARLLTGAGIAAILLVAVADGTLYRATGCSPNSHFGLVRALYHGEPTIDSYQWQTCDKSWIDGHFYATKQPGLALAALPAYAALRAVGLDQEYPPSVASFGANYDDTRGGIWPLVLWAVVVPIAVLLLLVRRVADELEPGFGTATAVTLGIATLLMPYGSYFFAHALSACLAFAAFAVLFGERRGLRSELRVAAGGLLAGLAFTTEYPMAIVVAGLGIYALSCQPFLRRGVAYGAGAVAGALPSLVFAWWALGSPIRSPYGHTVWSQGQTGHDIVGGNGAAGAAAGLFGVNAPSLHVATQLLFASNGLLKLAPVLALAGPGLVFMYRGGRRAEALLIGGTAVAFVTYNSGYYQPFGGEASGGPRLLTPLMPFLVLPLAPVFRRLAPAAVALGAISAAAMVVLAATSAKDPGLALHRLRIGEFTDTLAGAGSGWVGLVPFVLALLAACAFGALATKRPAWTRRGLEVAVAAVAAWLLIDGVGPPLLDRPRGLVDVAILAATAGCVAAVLCVSRSGLHGLWRAAPLIVLLVPSLAQSAAAVLLASLAALLLMAPLAFPRLVP